MDFTAIQKDLCIVMDLVIDRRDWEE